MKNLKGFEEIDFILFNYLHNNKNYIETVSRKNFIITPDGFSHINKLVTKKESTISATTKKDDSI